MMKEGMVFGMLVGLTVGALLFKHCPKAKELYNKGEEAVKQELNNIVKEMDKKIAK